MSLQVRHAPAFELTNLSTLIALPDPEAADALNDRMAALDWIDRVHFTSYSERGLIAIQFEERQLWKHLNDPSTGCQYKDFSAWAKSNLIASRRIIFEAKTDMKRLSDVPLDRLIDVPKGNIKLLTQLSTAVRNDPDVLEAAKGSPEAFAEKIEKEHPLQHIEARKPWHLYPGRSERKIMDKWIAKAMELGIAGSPTEAIVRACERALYDAELDEELDAMPAEEVLHDSTDIRTQA